MAKKEKTNENNKKKKSDKNKDDFKLANIEEENKKNEEKEKNPAKEESELEEEIKWGDYSGDEKSIFNPHAVLESDESSSQTTGSIEEQVRDIPVSDLRDEVPYSPSRNYQTQDIRYETGSNKYKTETSQNTPVLLSRQEEEIETPFARQDIRMRDIPQIERASHRENEEIRIKDYGEIREEANKLPFESKKRKRGRIT